MSWILIIYLGFWEGQIRTEYPSEHACRAAAAEWRSLNPRSDATLTCISNR